MRRRERANQPAERHAWELSPTTLDGQVAGRDRLLTPLTV